MVEVRSRNRIAAKQVQGVENPATVLCIPMSFSKCASWWSYDQILLGGIKVNSEIEKGDDGLSHCLVGYLPQPIPRSWGEKEFHIVVEYECDSLDAKFKFRTFYGCGDPSELHLGETDFFSGTPGEKKRLKFKLNEENLERNELFRVTLDVARETPDPILIYGVWLEVSA